LFSSSLRVGVEDGKEDWFALLVDSEHLNIDATYQECEIQELIFGGTSMY
jgi:hypothetical protein